MTQAILDLGYFILGGAAILGAGVMLRRHGQSVALQVCLVGDLAAVRAGIWIIVTVFVLVSCGFLLVIPAAVPFPEVSVNAVGWQGYRLPILSILSTAGGFILLVATLYTVSALVIVYRGATQTPPPRLSERSQ